MRKHLLAGALALAFLSLSGCSTLQTLFDAGKLATASIANPVTPDRLAAIENSLTVVFAAANTWKKLCLQGAAEANCRSNIAAAQVYTRKIPPLLAQLRSFVKTNDQVNAIVVYNQITALITNFKSTAAASPIAGGL